MTTSAASPSRPTTGSDASRPTKETFEPSAVMEEGRKFLANITVMALETGTTALVMDSAGGLLLSSFFLGATGAFERLHPEYASLTADSGPFKDLLCDCLMHQALRDGLAMGGLFVNDEGEVVPDHGPKEEVKA